MGILWLLAFGLFVFSFWRIMQFWRESRGLTEQAEQLTVQAEQLAIEMSELTTEGSRDNGKRQ